MGCIVFSNELVGYLCLYQISSLHWGQISPHWNLVRHL